MTQEHEDTNLRKAMLKLLLLVAIILAVWLVYRTDLPPPELRTYDAHSDGDDYVPGRVRR